MKNKFKGFGLVAWRTTDGGLQHCMGGGHQNHPQEKQMWEGKVVAWGGLKNSWENKRSERQRRKGKIYPMECRLPENSKERFENLHKWTVQELEENNRIVRSIDCFRKIGATRGTFHARMGTIKDRKFKDLTEADEIKKRWQECTEEL